MSVQYSDVPPAGVMNIPPSIPSGMLYRVKQIMGVSKQTLKLFLYPGRPPQPMAKKLLYHYRLIH
jgi:hypothetical protein